MYVIRWDTDYESYRSCDVGPILLLEVKLALFKQLHAY